MALESTSFRFEPDLLEALDKEAIARRTTRTGLLKDVLVAWLKAQGHLSHVKAGL